METGHKSAGIRVGPIARVQGFRCALCAAPFVDGDRRLRLRLLPKDPRHPRRLVCAGQCPDYADARGPALTSDELEAAIASLEHRFPEYVIRIRRPRGRPSLTTIEQHERLRERVVAGLGAAAAGHGSLTRIRQAMGLSERTFRRREAALRGAPLRDGPDRRRRAHVGPELHDLPEGP